MEMNLHHPLHLDFSLSMFQTRLKKTYLVLTTTFDELEYIMG